jgi:16S rRNA (guanine527-N7)-methyltransferase
MWQINRKLLESGITQLGLYHDGDSSIETETKAIQPMQHKIDQLIQYANLLHKWNKVYSLTAITNADDVLKYHLLDGLTLIPYIADARSIVDVGSGMGVPGIIIAIWYPQMRVVVVDSNNKKTTFLRQVAIELGLSNLTVLNTRVENYIPEIAFDVVTSRAFADIGLFIRLTKHLLYMKAPSGRQRGCFLAMKGGKIVQELNEASMKNDLLSDYQIDILKVYIPEMPDNPDSDLELENGVELERFLIKIQDKM